MKFRKTLLASAVASLALAAPAFAQSGTAPQAVGDTATSLETVTVTARKREEIMTDVPVAVSAISGRELEEKQIYQAKDIATLVPGLNITSDGVTRSFVDIRGVGTTLIDTVQPGVGIFIDGVYQPNTSYLNSPLVDVERIEVLRGPQGTLFGQNTLGGAINVVTKRPTDDFSGKLSGAYAGNDNFESLAGSISGPIIKGQLQGRLGLAYHAQDGFQKNSLLGGTNANPLQQHTANGTLTWEPGFGRFTVNGYYERVFGATTPYSIVSGPTDYSDDVMLNQNNLSTLVYTGTNLKGEFDLPGLNTKVTAITAYDNRSGVTAGDGDFGPVDLIRVHGDTGFHTSTGELRFDTAWTDNLSSLFGVFADRNLNKSNAVSVVGGGAPVTAEGRIATNVFALYGTMFWNLGKTVELTAGLRYDHQNVSSSGSTSGVIGADQFEPRVTLAKHWARDFMSYASVARGFRGGGVNPPGSPNPTYQGDSVWTYELGSKGDFLNNRLSIETAAFLNDYQHYIGQNSLAPTTGGFVAINLNTGHVISPGAELEARYKLSRWWSANAGVTVLHTRIIDGGEYERTTGMALPSNRVLFLPDWNFNLGTSYTVPIGSDKLVFDGGLVAKGNRQGSTLNADAVPTLHTYYVLNGSAIYRHRNWEFALFGNNLLDQKYFETYLDKSLLTDAGFSGPLAPLAHDLGIIGERRRVGLRAGYRF